MELYQQENQKFKINHNYHKNYNEKQYIYLIYYMLMLISHFLPPPPTLNLKKQISPSSTTYSFPYYLYFPSALTAVIVPRWTKSSYFITSAQINPFSKSVWITPAAYGALVPALIVQHLTSSSPAVKK